MRDLNTMFPNAKGYATEANARRKLDKLAGAIPETALTVTIPRASDGRWLAIVILGERDLVNIPFLCNAGVCVTN